jgi:hypothetical protein
MLVRFLGLTIALLHFDAAFRIAQRIGDLQLLPHGDQAQLEADVETCAELGTRHVLAVADDAAASLEGASYDGEHT